MGLKALSDVASHFIKCNKLEEKISVIIGVKLRFDKRRARTPRRTHVAFR